MANDESASNPFAAFGTAAGAMSGGGADVDALAFNIQVAQVFLVIPTRDAIKEMRLAPPVCIAMQDDSSAAHGRLFQPADLQHVIFDRLLRPAASLQSSRVMNPTISGGNDAGSECGRCDERRPLRYLGECFFRLRRLVSARSGVGSAAAITSKTIGEFESIILENLRTGLLAPEVFSINGGAACELPQSQLLDLVEGYYDTQLSTEMNELIRLLFGAKKPNGEDAWLDGVDDALFQVFDEMQSRLRKVIRPGAPHALMEMRRMQPILNALGIISTLKAPALSFMNFSVIRPAASNSRAGRSNPVLCEQSLLGLLFMPSCVPRLNPVNGLPQQRPAQQHYFEYAEIQADSVKIAHTEQAVWLALDQIVNELFVVVNNLVRVSADVQKLVMQWFGMALSLNRHRGRPWDPYSESGDPPVDASHGFMLNVLHVLLRLCQPFLKPQSPQLLKISWLYSALPSPPSVLSTLSEETTLVPRAEALKDFKPTGEFSFLTTLFFVTQYACKIGFTVSWTWFKRCTTQMSHLEREYQRHTDQNRAAPDASEAEHIENLKGLMEKMAESYWSMRALLSMPQRMRLMLAFGTFSLEWCRQIALLPAEFAADAPMPTQFAEATFPLPESVSPAVGFVPELCIEAVEDTLSALQQMSRGPGKTVGVEVDDQTLNSLMTSLLVFIGSPERMRNPHLRGRMATLIHNFMPPSQQYDESRGPTTGGLGLRSLETSTIETQRELLFRNHPASNGFICSLLSVFCSIEMTGSTVEFYEKFQYRRPMYALLRYLLSLPSHREKLAALAVDSLRDIDSTNPPVFLRFINLLCNDATFLLDEALLNMQKLKQMERDREATSSRPPPANEQEQQERDQKEEEFQRTAGVARFDNILGLETISAVESLTEFPAVRRMLCADVLCERVASMFNFFLVHLVDPEKRRAYRVKDLGEYEFRPKKILKVLVNCYSNMSQVDLPSGAGGEASSAQAARRQSTGARFLTAVVHDERSFSSDLMRNTLEVMRLIDSPVELVVKMRQIAAELDAIKRERDEENELIRQAEDSEEGIPDEFLDPITSELMREPMRLPASGQIVDKSSIARHLLSDQTDPFNRQPLNMGDLVPLPELRRRISEWRAQLRLRAGQRPVAETWAGGSESRGAAPMTVQPSGSVTAGSGSVVLARGAEETMDTREQLDEPLD